MFCSFERTRSVCNLSNFVRMWESTQNLVHENWKIEGIPYLNFINWKQFEYLPTFYRFCIIFSWFLNCNQLEWNMKLMEYPRNHVILTANSGKSDRIWNDFTRNDDEIHIVSQIIHWFHITTEMLKSVFQISPSFKGIPAFLWSQGGMDIWTCSSTGGG